MFKLISQGSKKVVCLWTSKLHLFTSHHLLATRKKNASLRDLHIGFTTESFIYCNQNSCKNRSYSAESADWASLNICHGPHAWLAGPVWLHMFCLCFLSHLHLTAWAECIAGSASGPRTCKLSPVILYSVLKAAAGSTLSLDYCLTPVSVTSVLQSSLSFLRVFPDIDSPVLVLDSACQAEDLLLWSCHECGESVRCERGEESLGGES